MPRSPASKCHSGLTQGGPAGAGTPAPGLPSPPPFAARPPGSDTLFFGTGRLCAGRAHAGEGGGGGGQGGAPGPARPPGRPSLETRFSSAAARLAFYRPTPALPGLQGGGRLCLWPRAGAPVATRGSRALCAPGPGPEPGVPRWGVGTPRPKLLLAPFMIREPGASETWNFRSGWSWAPRSQVDTPHLPTPGPRMPRTCRPHRGLILNRGGE